MATKAGARKSTGASRKLLTLSEVSRRTKISMPTLQRYKKLYQDRIPSQGEGRKQRYPVKSLAIFKQIKKENIGKRGRPRKSSAAADATVKRAMPPKKSAKKPAKKAAKSKAATRAAASGDSGLLTLSQIQEQTGISYPTLLRYKKSYLSRLPHTGTGRNTRFKPEAVAVFLEIRGKSKRGAPKKAASPRSVAGTARAVAASSVAALKELPREAEKRIKDLEKTYLQLQKKFDRLVKKLKKPLV